jgi:hypothetical protein
MGVEKEAGRAQGTNPLENPNGQFIGEGDDL